MINLLKVQGFNKILDRKIKSSVLSVIESGIYVGGNEVIKFEENFSTYTNSKYCISTGNGLDSIRLALIAADIKAGDEVIVPAQTFIATWLAVSQISAIPVPVDIDKKTYNINASKIEEKITSRTKAIIVVHLFGRPCEMDTILLIAKKYKLIVIEDAAQAHGTVYKGKKVGSISDLTAWSFYPGKNLGGIGDGGAITTNNKNYALKIKELRNYGSSEKYIHTEKGWNSRLDSLQAAVLNEKLKFLDSYNRKRKEIAEKYIQILSKMTIILPAADENRSKNSWHLFVILVKNRNEFIQKMLERSIECAVHYPIPPFKQDAYKEYFNNDEEFTNANIISNNCVSLPIGPHLTIDEINYICQSISDIFKISNKFEMSI